MFAFISLEAIKGAVVSVLQQLGKVILTLMVFVAVLAIIYPLLPDDPFRDTIISYGQTVKQYYDWVNWFIDVPLLSGTMLFYAMWRYAYWVYRHVGGIVMDKDGQLSFDA